MRGHVELWSSQDQGEKEHQSSEGNRPSTISKQRTSNCINVVPQLNEISPKIYSRVLGTVSLWGHREKYYRTRAGIQVYGYIRNHTSGVISCCGEILHGRKEILSGKRPLKTYGKDVRKGRVGDNI